MSTDKIGVLLINLGTPPNTSIKSIRKYLREFLSDPRVIDVHPIIRTLLLNLFILPFRPYKTQKAYQSIWKKNGSPLLVISQQLQQLVQKDLGHNYQVALGMRYGQPSIKHAITSLLENCQKIIVLPLYPQYASASTGTSLVKVMSLMQTEWNLPHITFINEFFQHPLFIKGMANNIKNHPAFAQHDTIIMSYHGLPERHLDKSGCKASCDRQKSCPSVNKLNRYCYRAQCFQTSRLIAEKLNLPDNAYQVTFQSRLGRTPWIKPYTDQCLPMLYKQGHRKLLVVCPAFTADCLETLEEIGIQAKESWLKLGGEALDLIPCVNTDPIWIKCISQLIRQEMPYV